MNDASTSNTILGHLLELRKGLVRSIMAVVLATAVLFPFANQLYLLLAHPLMSSLALDGGRMIATQVASPFLTPFKLSLISGIFCAMPVLLYQLWSFVAPGLYKHEKKLALPLLLMSIVLFYVGMAFAYFIVFPIMFGFLTGTAPNGVQVATDIALYLDFAIKMFFAFGLAFQIPVATVLCILMGFVDPKNMRQKRPYVIVAAFVLGMLLTPPDIISQTLLAIPIWLLFEAGVWLGLLLKQQRQGNSISPSLTPTAEQSEVLLGTSYIDTHETLPSVDDFADEFGESEDYVEPSDTELEALLDNDAFMDKTKKKSKKSVKKNANKSKSKKK